jgi:hypothetical protein
VTYDSDASLFAEINRELLAGTDAHATLQRAVELAVATIGPCDMAGVSVRQGRNQVSTPAWTDDLVTKLDAEQYRLQEGPCLDAVFIDEVYVVEDMANEDRWPRWAPFAAGLGVGSIVSVGCPPTAT